MTLHAPRTNGQACKLIARRLILGRPAVMAICTAAFATAVVTSSHSNYDVPLDAAPSPDERIAAHGPVPMAASFVSATVPTTFLRDTAPEPALPEAGSDLRAVIEAEHPKFELRPLPDMTIEGPAKADGIPAIPMATVEMASLAPPRRKGISAGDVLPSLAGYRFPDHPATGSAWIGTA